MATPPLAAPAHSPVNPALGHPKSASQATGWASEAAKRAAGRATSSYRTCIGAGMDALGYRRRLN